MSVTVFEDPFPESGNSMQEYIDSHFGHSTDDDE